MTMPARHLTRPWDEYADNPVPHILAMLNSRFYDCSSEWTHICDGDRIWNPRAALKDCQYQDRYKPDTKLKYLLRAILGDEADGHPLRVIIKQEFANRVNKQRVSPIIYSKSMVALQVAPIVSDMLGQAVKHEKGLWFAAYHIPHLCGLFALLDKSIECRFALYDVKGKYPDVYHWTSVGPVQLARSPWNLYAAHLTKVNSKAHPSIPLDVHSLLNKLNIPPQLLLRRITRGTSHSGLKPPNVMI